MCVNNIERLIEVCDSGIAMGDFDWVGTAAMQQTLQGDCACDEDNKLGKKNLTRSDEEIWASASRRAASRSRAIWTTSTCWRNGTRSRCDYIITPSWTTSSGYHFVTPPEVAADHDMIALRINIAERAAPRSRVSGMSTSVTRETWRCAADMNMRAGGTTTAKLQNWDEVFKGKLQSVEGGRMRARAATHRL